MKYVLISFSRTESIEIDLSDESSLSCVRVVNVDSVEVDGIEENGGVVGKVFLSNIDKEFRSGEEEAVEGVEALGEVEGLEKLELW